uniref:Uncharacterized protein n=1 Tax=Amphimedon queenslandica TaxID=400682 RepID=A0A1X7UPC4_AMPQE
MDRERDRGLGSEEAVIIKSGSCLWLVLMDLGTAEKILKEKNFRVLAWLKDYNVVLKILAMEYVVHILHKDCNVVLKNKLFDQWCFHNGGGVSFQLHRFHIVIVLAIEYIYGHVAVPPAPAPASWPASLKIVVLNCHMMSCLCLCRAATSRGAPAVWSAGAAGGCGRTPPPSSGGPPATGGRSPASGGGPPSTGGGLPATGGSRGIGGGGGGGPPTTGGGGGGTP